jgi:hypothetical protein
LEGNSIRSVRYTSSYNVVQSYRPASLNQGPLVAGPVCGVCLHDRLRCRRNLRRLPQVQRRTHIFGSTWLLPFSVGLTSSVRRGHCHSASDSRLRSDAVIAIERRTHIFGSTRSLPLSVGLTSSVRRGHCHSASDSHLRSDAIIAIRRRTRIFGPTRSLPFSVDPRSQVRHIPCGRRRRLRRQRRGGQPQRCNVCVEAFSTDLSCA